MGVRIRLSKTPSDDYTAHWHVMDAFNEETIGDARGEAVSLVISPEDGDDFLGGLWGHALWGSFYIGFMFVPAEHRRSGIGSELMRRAEAEAKSKGCRHMWLETYAFQARPFYERHGFEVFGQLDGPPPMFPRYFLQKALAVDGNRDDTP
jgi:GNAT superfamily N-acetyltransferase